MILRILYYYYRTLFLKRYLNSPHKLATFHTKQFNKLIKKALHKSPFYQPYLNKPLHEWPLMDKNKMMEHFDVINTQGIKKEDAFNLALKAEASRNFSPLMKNHISVGLSSGTSGRRGLFLASPKERDAWVGIMLAKLLPNGFKTRERIALFLRANNRLYTSINHSQKIKFVFFDLLSDFEHHIAQLNALKPTILCAPASVLLFLSQQRTRLMFYPKKIVAVAEVLEKKDENKIKEAFGLPVTQLYQCTEGFLAISDKHSNELVMNDDVLIIEKEWIDEYRFIPIITDLLRTTQPIIRYRLDDVLIANVSNETFTGLTAIEGRLGDTLYAKKGNDLVPIFSDVIRQKMASIPIEFEDYQICQNTVTEWTIAILPEVENKTLFIAHLNQLFEHMKCQAPNWNWNVYQKPDFKTKQRRIQSMIVGEST